MMLRRLFTITATVAIGTILVAPSLAQAEKVTFHKQLNTTLATVLDGVKVFKKKDTIKFLNNIFVPKSAKLTARKLNATGRIMNPRESDGEALPVTVKDDLAVTGSLQLNGYSCEAGQVFGWDGSSWGCTADDTSIVVDDPSSLTGGTGIEIADGVISRAGISHTLQIPLASWVAKTSSTEATTLSSTSTPALKIHDGGVLRHYPYIEWTATADDDNDSVETQFTVPSDYVPGTDITVHVMMHDATDAFNAFPETMALQWTPFVIGESIASTADGDEVTVGDVSDHDDDLTKDYTFTIPAASVDAAGTLLSLQLYFDTIDEKWELMNTYIEYTGY